MTHPRPSVLYHGTLRSLKARILAHGLAPRIGANVRSAYDADADPRIVPLVFASESPQTTIAAMMTQIAASTGKAFSRINRDDVATLGMVVEVPAAGFEFCEPGQSMNGVHPPHVEEEDWYTDRRVKPLRFWTKTQMRDLADGRIVRTDAAVRENPSNGAGDVIVLAPHMYPAKAEYETPRGAFVRSVAHDLKSATPAALRVAAAAMATLVPCGATLVPVPGSRGSTRENLALAEAIARLTGARVEDGLEREPGESQHVRRLAGRAPQTEHEMKLRWSGGRLRDPIVLIDNVVTSGATARSCACAIGRRALLLVWADAQTPMGRRENPAAKSDIRVRGELAEVPVGMARPVVFHNLRLAMTNNASAELSRLIQEGAHLSSPDRRAGDPQGPWRAQDRGLHSIGKIDIQAGDGRFVFFTIARPPGLGNSVAFDLETLAEVGNVGWRAGDLMPVYDAAIRGGMQRELEQVATAFTVWDRDAVRRAARLEATALFAERKESRLAAFRALHTHWNRWVWDTEAVQQIRQRLSAAGRPIELRFSAPRLDEELVRSGEGRKAGLEGSEIVLDGSVPMRACLAWYDTRAGRWRKP